MPHSPAPPRLLLIRFSSIGDVLLTTPLIRVLRARLPDARLAFLTRRAFTPLVSDHPALDDVIALDPGRGLPALARRLREERFTHVLDLHGSLRTRVLRLLVPARWRGYRHHRAARGILIRTRRDVYPRHLPVPERYFDAARDFGVTPDGGPPEFHLGETAEATALGWLADRGLGTSRPVAALAPGAAHGTKQWPRAHWAAFIPMMVARGWDCVLVGGPADRALAEGLAAEAGAHVASAAGRFGLQETGATIRRARVLVSGDTGVMHMATAVGTPVVALFGPTVRQFGFYPYRAPHEVLEQALSCRPCTAWGGERCPLGHHRCLVDTTPAAVLAAAERLTG